MDPLSDLLDAIMAKCRALDWITDPENAIFGETHPHEMMGFADDKFNRIEVLINDSKEEGDVDQYSTDEAFRINVAGFIKRETLSTSEDDMKDLINFANATKKAIKGFNREKMEGNPPCKGFVQMGQYAKIFYEYEFIDCVGSFLLDIEIKLNLDNGR